ncbi:MAG: sugar phosphate isomerase/epimerase [Archaeoglobaceae archaeon]
MKVGIQPDVRHTPKEAFEFAATNGFDHVEILMDHPYYTLEAISYAELTEMRWSYDLDLLIHAPATSTNFISLSRNMRKASYKELAEVCYLADRCGAEVVTVHIGWNPAFINNGEFFFDRTLFDEHNERVLMEEFYEFVKNANVVIAVENTILVEGGIRRALERIMEDTDLSLTLDVGHYNIQENPFFLERFERVVNIHVHDNNGKSDEHLALGRGNIDLHRFPLHSYDNFLTIETRNEKAIIETRDRLKQLGVVV